VCLQANGQRQSGQCQRLFQHYFKEGIKLFNRIFSILQSFWFFVLNQQEEPTTKPSERMLSTKQLTACQE
jgi:hypothetical protein